MKRKASEPDTSNGEAKRRMTDESNDEEDSEDQSSQTSFTEFQVNTKLASCNGPLQTLFIL